MMAEKKIINIGSRKASESHPPDVFGLRAVFGFVAAWLLKSAILAFGGVGEATVTLSANAGRFQNGSVKAVIAKMR